MTRLSGTPYDRLAAPGSLSETQARAKDRTARMAAGGEMVPAARLIAAEAKAAERLRDLSATIARLEATLALKSAPKADPAQGRRIADLEAALGQSKAALLAAETETARLNGEVAALKRQAEEAAEFKALSQANAAARHERRVAALEATISDLKTRLAAAASTPGRESEVLGEVTRLEAELAAARRSASEAIADRDHARRERDLAVDRLAQDLVARAAEALARLGGAKVEAAPKAKSAPSKSPSGKPVTAAPKGKPYVWPAGYGK
ncbi:hypothetical protein [Chenggangzhangella methanolivorans]|uniref:Uncharacterized protein n=1 Tax=Chenggangzhangella methanolivorans TaxID=1437009 RepID=A0A9E6UM79_9HYPH|nr:hypothetical protein [Chenggangzhangella methanolivorans]QZN99775.1 hypothetical protein K6K41_24445 [Chenggangzhangella methanolivorans]